MKRNETSTRAAKSGLEALLYQLLETELGGVEVYRAALRCVINPGLKEEWDKYLGETEHHVEIARELVTKAGLDPDAEVPARLPVRLIGEALIGAMTQARKHSTAAEAELTAAECVVEAETKDHLNWELLGLVAAETKGDLGRAMKEAFDEVEKEEDHHLYHTTGWARELWIQALGMPAALPPPEEAKKVETAIGAARAKNARHETI